MKFDRSIMMAALAASLTFSAGPALAQEHDHEDDGHADIDVHLHDGHIELDPLYTHHDSFEFVESSPDIWETRHESNTWPGFGGELGSAFGSIDIDFTAEHSLYYWDGQDATGLAPLDTTSTAFIDLLESATGIPGVSGGSLTIGADTGQQTLSPVVQTTSDGDIHNHPVWQLGDDGGEPADGAYLVQFSLDSPHPDLEGSELSGILFHKGLDHDTYEDAAEQAQAIVPEPGSLALLSAGGLMLLTRRRRG